VHAAISRAVTWGVHQAFYEMVYVERVVVGGIIPPARPRRHPGGQAWDPQESFSVKVKAQAKSKSQAREKARAEARAAFCFRDAVERVVRSIMTPRVISRVCARPPIMPTLGVRQHRVAVERRNSSALATFVEDVWYFAPLRPSDGC
jgi:hypothetical protein